MQALLRQMDECANLSHCPHGRPTWLRYDTGVIERAFKRTVQAYQKAGAAPICKGNFICGRGFQPRSIAARMPLPQQIRK